MTNNFVRFGGQLINPAAVSAVYRGPAGVTVLTGGFHEHKFADPAEADAVWRYFRGMSEDGAGTPAGGPVEGTRDMDRQAVAKAIADAVEDRDMQWANAVRAWGESDAQREVGLGINRPPGGPDGVADVLNELAADAVTAGRRQLEAEQRQQKQVKAG